MKANHDLIGQNIVKYRIENKLSQKDFAKIIDINPSSLSDIECGRKPAGIVLLMKMSKILRINVDSLLEGNFNFVSNDYQKTDSEKMKNLYKLLENSTLNQKKLFVEILEKYINP